jgi:hypothetical protein
VWRQPIPRVRLSLFQNGFAVAALRFSEGNLAIDQYSLSVEIFAGYSGSVLAPFTLNVPAIDGASVFG